MKRLFYVFLALCLVTLFFSTTLTAKVKVGEEILEKSATTHPYKGGEIVQKIYHYPEAGYIAIHFSKFDLAPGDYVEISNAAGTLSYTYQAKGKVVRGGKAVISEFWATHIPGDTAVVTLHSKNPKGGWGFEIDKWVRGYPRNAIDQALFMLENTGDANIESICGTDDKDWAKCHEGTTMYDKAKAVCRLLMNGSSACTGWLLGSEGHVMTNNHCIENQSDADNTDFEFMAEGSTCATDCSSWLACPGTVEADHGTLIAYDSALDYALVLLPTNITGTYGYMQLREILPTIDERIYIPQHPSAYGKQLAVFSTDSHDQSGYGEIYTTSTTPCTGGPGDIGYYADTAGGSSGSPVLAYADHAVVALHHCAACPNRGVPIPAIISDLGSNLPNDAISGTGNQYPNADFSYTTNLLTANFTDLSTDADGTIVSWDWDFGDGGTSTVQNPSHTYVANGTYTVTLTVTDDGNASDSAVQDVTVSDGTGPAITLSGTAYKVRGSQYTDLTWTGATGTNINVYLDGVLVATTANDGAYTHITGRKGGGTGVYKVTETDGSSYSNEVTVVW